MIAKGTGETKRAAPPRFVADAMLGRLAKWLRMMGYDVLFLGNADDIEVLRVSRGEGRLLLTRDRLLARRAGELGVLVESQRLEEQLRELAARGFISGPLESTRCPVCNTLLEELPRAEARDKVPPYVYQTHREFYACPTCGRVYWPGTHWQNVRATWQSLGWREEEA